MKFTLEVDRNATTKEGFSVLRLIGDPNVRLCELDTQYSELASIPEPPAAALDLLLLAAAVYAADKVVLRESAEDCWTRQFALSLPVSTPAAWTAVQDELGSCISFLTGDRWTFDFNQRDTALVCSRSRRRTRLIPTPKPGAVSLFSGGLDSLVGVIDWLETHPGEPLLAVGHHDGQIAGPFSDQRTLLP